MCLVPVPWTEVKGFDYVFCSSDEVSDFTGWLVAQQCQKMQYSDRKEGQACASLISGPVMHQRRVPHANRKISVLKQIHIRILNLLAAE